MTARFATREGTNDNNVVAACYREDEYHLRGWVRPGDVCVDIGAHIGGASVLMASLGGIVYAVEPLSDNYRLLRVNMEGNGYDASHCTRAALLGQDGETIIYLTPADPVHCNIGQGWTPTAAGETVMAISLDTLLAGVSAVRVLKLDCEGAEYEALEGASRETLAKIERIVGEVHRCGRHTDAHPRAVLFGMTRGLFVDASWGEDPELGTASFDFRRGKE
jgi:FkbM family methyltransferase